MSFQFGTNWPGYMETVGNVAGPLLAYEVLTAFFLEATFLGIMLFGTGRVTERIHTLATWLVAIGTTLSAFWILALNSWMQTPAGFEMIDGKAHATTGWAILFNPSLPYRLTHMLHRVRADRRVPGRRLSAYRWLRGDRAPTCWRRCAPESTGGDPDPDPDRRRRPAWAEHAGAPAGEDRGDGRHLEDRARRAAAAVRHARRGGASNRFEIGIPKLASLILTHDATARSRASTTSKASIRR